MNNQSRATRGILARRLSRRRAVQAAVAGAAALGLSACAGDDDDEGGMQTPEAASTPKPGGKVTLAVSGDQGSHDPHVSLAAHFTGPRIYSPLHMINSATQELLPLVAGSVEQVDNTTVVWNLRRGVKFQNIDPMNGREVVAEDVVYSYDRFKNAGTMNDKAVLVMHTERFEAPDDYTFKLITNKPYAGTLDQTGLGQYAIVAREAVERWGDLSLHSGGCGPWILGDVVRDERTRFRKNPDYFRPGRPYPDEEEWLIIADTTTQWQALRTGRLDWPLWLSPDKFKREEARNDASITIVPNPARSMPVIWVRQDKPPFNDERVREALDIGIDRDDYIEKIDFGEGRYNGVLPWTVDFWALPQEELREILKYDPDKAKQLLSAAGHSDGFEIRAPTRNDGNAIQATSVVAEHYSKLGVKVNIQAQEVGVWLVALFSSDFDITLSGTLSIWEPDYCLSFYYSGTEDDPNFTGINDPQIDSLIEGSWAIMGREERRDHLLEVQRDLLKKHGPVYQLSSPEAYVACNSKLNGVYPPAGVLYWSGTEYWVNES